MAAPFLHAPGEQGDKGQKNLQTVGLGLSPWCAPPRQDKGQVGGAACVGVQPFRDRTQHSLTTTRRARILHLSSPPGPTPTIPTGRTQPKELDVTTGTSFPSREHANGVVDGVFMTKSDSRNPRQLGEYPVRARGQPGTLVGEHIQGPRARGWGAGLGIGESSAASRQRPRERGTDSGNCSVYPAKQSFYLGYLLSGPASPSSR